jgi:hypothetical protein
VTGDHINASFELLGAVFAWRNTIQIYRDRSIAGVWWPMWLFLCVWGAWNLYYYPSLGQWWSFAAGIVLVSANVAWVVMALLIKRFRWGR